MKGAKLIFVGAGIAFVGFVVCLIWVLTSSSKSASEVASETIVETEEETVAEEEPVDEEELALQEEAQSEIDRFKDSYGMEISMEDMLQQVRIRHIYEQEYGHSYDLEDVFLASQPEEGDSDEDADEMFQMFEEIEQYVKKYSIDVSRYNGMSVKEELDAIKVEYGELDDETDSAYYVPDETDDGEEGDEEESLTKAREGNDDEDDTSE
jgi:hypothetical protein